MYRGSVTGHIGRRAGTIAVGHRDVDTTRWCREIAISIRDRGVGVATPTRQWCITSSSVRDVLAAIRGTGYLTRKLECGERGEESGHMETTGHDGRGERTKDSGCVRRSRDVEHWRHWGGVANTLRVRSGVRISQCILLGSDI